MVRVVVRFRVNSFRDSFSGISTRIAFLPHFNDCQKYKNVIITHKTNEQCLTLNGII